MSGWTTFWVTVAASVVAAAFRAVGGRVVKVAWQAAMRFPRDVVNLVELRGTRREKEAQRRLVSAVVERGKALGIELPVSVSGHLPVQVWFSGGSVRPWFPDFRSYRSAAHRREVNPLNAGVGTPPRVVGRWSRDELHAWLDAHPYGASGPR